MQAIFNPVCNWPYPDDMRAGRPSKAPRSPFGQRLFSLREEKGLSQQQVAEKLGISQQSYALWERRSVALKPEQLAQLAEIVGTTVDFLVGHQYTPPRKGGPVGRTRLVFEQVSKLPRHHQQKIIEVVDALLSKHLKAS